MSEAAPRAHLIVVVLRHPRPECGERLIELERRLRQMDGCAPIEVGAGAYHVAYVAASFTSAEDYLERWRSACPSAWASEVFVADVARATTRNGWHADKIEAAKRQVLARLGTTRTPNSP